MSRTLAAVVAVALVLISPPGAGAASPTERLRAFFASATSTIEDPRPEFKLEERMDAIRALVRDIFDIPEAAKLALGPQWSARSADERTEFVRLFAELVERSFISGIAARIRLSDGVHVSFIDEAVEGTQATVRTAIASKSGAELAFNYRMIERGQRWAVRDVIVDGVSLAANYRAQFGRILQSGSYSELIHQLRARVPGTGMVAMVVAAEDPGPAVSLAAAPRPPAAEAPGAKDAAAPLPLLDSPREAATVAPESEVRQTLSIALARAEPPQTPSAGILVPGATTALTRVPVPPAAHLRSFWVQVGAFANVETARRLASALADQEPPTSRDRWVVVVESAAGGAPLARVQVGPFTTRADAAAKLKDIQTRGFQPFVAERRD